MTVCHSLRTKTGVGARCRGRGGRLQGSPLLHDVLIDIWLRILEVDANARSNIVFDPLINLSCMNELGVHGYCIANVPAIP